MPEMIVPNTHKKQQPRPSSRPLGGEGERSSFGRGPPGGDRPGGGFGRGRMGGEREGYRSGPKEPSSVRYSSFWCPTIFGFVTCYREMCASRHVHLKTSDMAFSAVRWRQAFLRQGP